MAASLRLPPLEPDVDSFEFKVLILVRECETDAGPCTLSAAASIVEAPPPICSQHKVMQCHLKATDFADAGLPAG